LKALFVLMHVMDSNRSLEADSQIYLLDSLSVGCWCVGAGVGAAIVNDISLSVTSLPSISVQYSFSTTI
jgi:hypothetical protein